MNGLRAWCAAAASVLLVVATVSLGTGTAGDPGLARHTSLLGGFSVALPHSWSVWYTPDGLGERLHATAQDDPDFEVAAVFSTPSDENATTAERGLRIASTLRADPKVVSPVLERAVLLEQAPAYELRFVKRLPVGADEVLALLVCYVRAAGARTVILTLTTPLPPASDWEQVIRTVAGTLRTN